MKPVHSMLANALLAVAIGPISISLVSAADNHDPLNPSFMTEQEKTYFKEKIGQMDVQGEGKVTKDGYLSYYSKLWDKNVPPGGAAVSIDKLAQKWAGLESQNPLDPEYKTVLWRNEHVKEMDTDKNGSVTKEEFLSHMEKHWVEETRQSQSTTLTHEQAMQAMTRNPLDPNYKVH